MKQNQTQKNRPKDKTTGAGGTGGNETEPVLIQPESSPPALPPARKHPACESNCVDLTGHPPEDVRVDPDITEGHPGYQESGDSEITPPDRLAKGEAAAEEESSR